MANKSISSAFIALPKLLWKVLRWQLCGECFSPLNNAAHSLNDTHELFQHMNDYRNLSVAELDYYLLCVPSQSLSVLFMALDPLCYMLYSTEYKDSPVSKEYLNWGFCKSDPSLVKAWIAT